MGPSGQEGRSIHASERGRLLHSHVIGYTSWETAFMKAIGAGVVKDRFCINNTYSGLG